MAASIFLHLDDGFEVGVDGDSKEGCNDHDHEAPVKPVVGAANEWGADDMDSFNDEDVARDFVSTMGDLDANIELTSCPCRRCTRSGRSTSLRSRDCD